MKCSSEGCLSIIAFEGVILDTYLDSAGIPTIGIGHTRAAGLPTPVMGMSLSVEDAVRLLQRDLEKYEREVSQHISVELKQHEFDALVSWHFNTGGVVDSTLKDKLNSGDRASAAKEFARWNKATIDGQKKVLKGLTRRRAREQDIFSDADYGDETIIVKEDNNKRAFTKGEFAKLLENQPAPEADVQPAPEEELSTRELLANPSSSLLPRYRPRQKDAITLATIAKFSHLLPQDRRSDAVYVLSIRGYYTDTMGKEGVNDRSIYDDAMFVVEPDGVHNFNANTDPSRYKPRIAKLKSPQAVLYKPGLHGHNRKAGPYPAFRQASHCTVVRDGVGDDTDRAPNFFWINLHRGGVNGTSSAGCQTIPPHQWQEFRHLLYSLLKKHNQKDFYYILVDESEKAKEGPMTDTGKTTTLPAGQTEAERLANALQVITALLAGRQETAPPAKEPANEVTVTVPVVQEPVATTPVAQSGGGSTLATLIALLQQIEAARTGHASGALPVKPPLTPVNEALGQTVGHALNGKKTVLGTIGLLATTLLPALTPAIPGLAPVSAAVNTIAPVALPVLSALTGWGVLGKIDKWFATRTRR